MKRIVLSLLVVLSGMAAMAQTTEYEGFGIYGLDNGPKVKKNQFGIELAVGGEAGLGIRLQHNFGKYFAWDILQVKYAYNYTGCDIDEEDDDEHRIYVGEDKNNHKVGVMTGVRAFTPSFANDKIKGYASFAVGYGRTVFPELSYRDYYSSYYGGYPWYYEENVGHNHCALDFSVGFKFKKFHIGYGLFSMTGDWGMTDHTVRLGLTF
jgi:hypothetical protein